MQRLVIFILVFATTECLSANNQRHVIISPQGMRITITPDITQPRIPEPPRRPYTFSYDQTKKWKAAVSQRSLGMLQQLAQQNWPQNTSKPRQKALLGILARTREPHTKEALFRAGLDAGSFTRETAHKLGVAMQWQGRKLVALAQQQEPVGSRKRLP